MTIRFHKILVPLDGSDVAAQALPFAEDIAAQAEANLVLFETVPDLREEVYVRQNFQLESVNDATHQYHVDHANRWLQRQADSLNHKQIPTQIVVDVGEPAEKIIDYVTQNNIDLIVMSTHGRTGLARWVYGSVASKVLAAAPCAVLLVRAQLAAH